MQGSGGGNERANTWGAWLKSKGIASVLIDNAGVRNTNRIGGVLPVHLANDYYSTIQALKNNPDLDLQRHALMGFSLGATAVLLADKSPIKPQAVIALYPGTNGQCRITHEPTTKVMIFYGDQDDWGTYLGHRNTCQKATRKSDAFKFITLENAAHGFDSSWTGTWGCCGQNFTSASNPTATDVVKTQLFESFTSALLAPTSKTQLK